MGVKEERVTYNNEFRREMVDAPRELYINEGYEKFTMRRLAEKIGYSPTTLYIYFRGKDDLFFCHM
jgi:AcrR family transcriptional regulator